MRSDFLWATLAAVLRRGSRASRAKTRRPTITQVKQGDGLGQGGSRSGWIWAFWKVGTELVRSISVTNA